MNFSGVLIIDKEEGPTSHDVVGRVRRLFETRKVGHAGTLDPMATGVLLILIGPATRISQFLMGDAKIYEARIAWGAATDSFDRTGVIVATTDALLPGKETILAAMREMTGEIEQIPPMFSAKKLDGRPLYRLARKGLEVERRSERVVIHEFHLTDLDETGFRARVSCSKGTYIRALADVLGRRLGGLAHLAELRRLASGSFGIGQSHRLSDMEKAVAESKGEKEAMLSGFLIPIEKALDRYAALIADAATAARIGDGVEPEIAMLHGGPTRTGETIRLLDEAGRLLAVGEPDETGRKLSLLRVFCGGDERADNPLHHSRSCDKDGA